MDNAGSLLLLDVQSFCVKFLSLRMTDHKRAITTWNELAGLYQEKFMDLDLYNATYDAFCRLLDQGACVFEIGCGPGNITRYLLHARPDLQVEATDAAPNMVELARKNAPGARFHVMDGRDAGKLDRTFDGIVCGFCVPYLTAEETAKLIADCARLLRSGGIFYLSLIEDDPAKSGEQVNSRGDRMNIYYYEGKSLALLLEENGFEPAEAFRIGYPQEPAHAVHLVLLARKK